MGILKRQLALLLVLAMILTMLPISAYADSTDCAHENTRFEKDPRGKYWYYLHQDDPAYHVANYYMRTICSDCGETILEVRDYFAEKHVLNENSVCTLCGYDANENTCDHAATEVAWDTNNPIRYTPENATQHKVSGYQYKYCTNCMERVGTSYAAEELEDHELLVDGSCKLCGYAAGSGCGHEIEWVDSAFSNISRNQTQHKITKYKEPYCKKCQEIVGQSQEIAGEWEDHTWENDCCTACGIHRNCQHSQTIEEKDVSLPLSYESASTTQHWLYCYVYTFCHMCSQRITPSHRNNGVLLDHSFDASGVCTLCHYNSNCAHSNTTSVYNPQDAPKYTQYNADKHFVSRNMYQVCTDCNARLSEQVTEAFTLEAHVLDKDGKCVYCGYGMEEGYCTHPESATMWDTSTPITYTSKNENYHSVEGNQYHYCTTCMKRISDNFSAYEFENHTLDASGDCTQCNYRSGCAHSQTEKKLYNIQYESQDEDTHKVTTLYSKVCAEPNCGKVLLSVDTAYTEIGTEKHEFDGNTCTLCGYTRGSALAVTVTPGSLTAEKGSSISASATAVGGNGGYQYSWKVLLNGTLKFETPLSADASYSYTASEEGNWCFSVTVRDSGGHTATAQSDAITVRHTCNYKTVSTTKLVNKDLTHHAVVTTTYQECTICHATTDLAETTELEPHKAQGTSYEKNHPHQKFYICQCGAHPYLEGEFETAGGTIQEADLCCICHGHRYGDAKETANGTWEKTCDNCGLRQEVDAPENTNEPHVHEFVCDFVGPVQHPHRYVAYCSCGAVKTGNLSYLNCCKCTGNHVWGEAIRLSDGSFKEVCALCGTTQTTTPSGKVQDYYDAIDIITNRKGEAEKLEEMETGGLTLWKEVASEAAEKLTDAGFVYSTNVINALSNQMGTVIDAIGKETWEEQQSALWEKLILEMLSQQGVGLLEDSDYSAVAEDGLTWGSSVTSVMEGLGEEKIEALETNLKALEERFVTAGIKESIADAEDDLALFNRLNYAITGIGIAVDSAEAAAFVSCRNSVFAEVKKNEEYKAILDSLYQTATSANNTNLANAICNVREELDRCNEKILGQWVDSCSTFFSTMGGMVAGEGVQKAFEKAAEVAGIPSVALTSVTVGATIASMLLGYDEVYQEAELLMTYNQMDASLNIVQLLKDQDAPYMLQLWGLLQAEGCTQAQKFLEAWDDGLGLNEGELGITDDGIPAVNEALEKDKAYYIKQLELDS